MNNLSNPKAGVESKGKGRAAAPPRKNSKSLVERIGNPDSGASSSDDLRGLDPIPYTDSSAAGESDFGVSNRHLKTGMNGRLTMNGNVGVKGKGKGKLSDFHDEQLDGEDEGLYD